MNDSEKIDKLIDIIYECNKDYCPEVIDLEPDYKYKQNNCHGIDIKCKECWKETILKELNK